VSALLVLWLDGSGCSASVVVLVATVVVVVVGTGVVAAFVVAPRGGGAVAVGLCSGCCVDELNLPRIVHGQVRYQVESRVAALR
jgi:hypothetical protein